MTTKNNVLLSKDKQQYFGNDNFQTDNGNQYSNVNLKQSCKSSILIWVQDCCKTYNKVPDPAMPDKYSERKKFSSLDDSFKCLLLKINDKTDDKESEKRWKEDGSLSTIKESTLSLHIVAYEKLVEADASDSFDGKNTEDTKNDIPGSIRNKKQLLTSTFVIQNPFEFLRQHNDKVSPPEVSEFSASQLLLNPNVASKNGQQHIRQQQQQQHTIDTQFVQQPVVNNDQQNINLENYQQQQWQPPPNSTVLQQQSPHHSAVGMQHYPHQQMLNPVNADKKESLKQLITETRKLANEYLQQEEYSIYEFLEFVNDKKAEYGFSRDFDHPKIEKILKKADEVKLIEQNARARRKAKAQRAKISNSSDGIDSFDEDMIAVNSDNVGYGLDDSDDEIFDAFSSFSGLSLPLMLLPESFEDYLNVANGIQPNNNRDSSLQNNFYLAAIRYLDMYAEYGQLKLNRNLHNYGNHQISPKRSN